MAQGLITPQAEKHYDLYIGGERVPAQSGETFASINPTTGEDWATVAKAHADDVDQAVSAADAAFRSEAWRSLSPTERGRLLMRLGDRIGENAEHIAAIETRDNGKLYREQVAQLRAVPGWLYYYGGLADKVEGQVIPLQRQSVLNYTLREPLGVIGIIKPWNSPTMLAMMAVAPAVAAGNTVVIKPSEFTSASILEVMDLIEDIGFPPGVFNVVAGGGDVGALLTEHPGVSKVSFTGGSATGREVAATVSGRLAQVTLELGGKSPNIVFEDTDLEAAEAGVLAGIYAAAGQTCIAGSRALIQESIFDEFVDRLVNRARGIQIGDPMDPASEMGPLANEPQLTRVESFVDDAKLEGATVRTGGKRPEIAEYPGGYFYTPTLLASVTPDSRVCREEVFGPVLGVLPFRDEEHAVEIANDSEFGLAAGVWTLDVRRAHRMARALEAGTVWINTYRASAFNSPFGGYKGSGVGRENGMEAIYSYLQTKSVWCETSEEVQDPFVMKI